MKLVKIATLFVATTLSGLTFAQTTSTNTSNATTHSVAGATNQGNSQALSLHSYAPDTQTIRSAPSVGGNSYYGSFSSDNCMVSAGIGGSVVGFGMNAVTPVRDEQCSMLRVFERTQQAAAAVQSVSPVVAAKLRQAATDMLCMVSDEARLALSHQGLCSDFNVPTIAATEKAKTRRLDSYIDLDSIVVNQPMRTVFVASLN